MKLKQIGFFDALPAAERPGSLRRMCDGPASPNRDRIVQYLRNAHVLIASLGLAQDLLSEAHEMIGPPHVMTDGQWAWPLDLAYYVEKYNCHLPDEFVEHMAVNHWTCPQVSHPDDLTVDFYEKE